MNFLAELTEEDIMDFQRYLRFHESVDKKISKNDNTGTFRLYGKKKIYFGKYSEKCGNAEDKKSENNKEIKQ